MIKKLLPVFLALIGAALGIGAGVMLRPTPPPLTPEEAKAAAKAAEKETPPEELPDYLKLNNQFIVPVVKEGRVAAMVILALSLEVARDTSQEIFALEPKLRDEFLQVLFEHANSGGFDGSFTDGDNLVILRRGLLEAAQQVLGDKVSDVLINDIARQDSR
ncbi:MAG: flagellar basal body-associated FliL family protein [Cypionkella sp.]|nr:flagellar basal body-associated FliL family protein [Cypionkella sp.]